MANLDNFDLDAWSSNITPSANEKAEQASNTVDKDLCHGSCPDDTETQIRDLARIIVTRGIDITDGYENWRNVGFALANELGEGGRDIYHELSRQNSEYNYSECDKKYTSFLHSGGSGITIKSFFQMAKDAGIDLSQFAREHMPTREVSATSAITPSAKSNEKVVNNNNLGVLDSGMADGGLAEVAESASAQGTGYTFSDKMDKDNLVSSLKKIISLHGDEPAKCDAQLLGFLNVVSGIMGGANGTPENRCGIYGVYDGRRVYAPIYNIVYSGAGNDKGSLIFCKYLAYPIKNEMRREYEAEKQKYDTEMAEWEAKGKKERGAAPKEPVYRDPFVPGNSSSSAVYRAMNDNGGWGMMFETEADTVSSMIDSDYGNYSDLMRKAHHHETLSMNRVTDKIHIDIDEPRLSVFLTCTPGQLPSLFPSFENGLGSRFLYYNTPDDDVVFHDVFALKETPLEDIYKKMGNELLPLYHDLLARKGHPIQFVMSQSQQQEFVSTYSGILCEQFKMLGKGIRAFVFRMALECFRYAMILTTLRRLDEWQATFNASDADQDSIFKEEENALVCDDRDFQTAMVIMGCLINHTARVYAVLAKEDDNPFAQRGFKLTTDEMKVFKALPTGDFRTSDFIEIAAGEKISERTAQRMLGKFCNAFRIVTPVHRGVYNKPVEKKS